VIGLSAHKEDDRKSAGMGNIQCNQGTRPTRPFQAGVVFLRAAKITDNSSIT